MEAESESYYPDIRTTRAVITLDVINGNEDEFVSEAEETPDLVGPSSGISENGGWNWPSNDVNNNVRPISQRPRLGTPPLEKADPDLNAIYSVADLQKCGTCNVHIRGVQINLDDPAPTTCSACKSIVNTRLATSDTETIGTSQVNSNKAPEQETTNEAVSECYCVMC